MDSHPWAHSGPCRLPACSDGILLAGDAALTVDLNSVGGVLLGRQQVAGPPWYTTLDWPAAKRSVGALAELEPQVLLSGHGRPLTTGAAAALHALAQGRPHTHRHHGDKPGCSGWAWR